MTLTRRWLIAALTAAPFLSAARAVAQDASVPPPDGEPQTLEQSDLARNNVATLTRYMAAFNAGDIPTAVAFFAPDTRNHGKPVGQAGLTRVLTELRTLFPDYRQEAVEVTAVADTVIVRTKVTGTHKGVGKMPVEGGMLMGVAPTGRSFVVQHIHWWRLKDGLIVEHYAARNDLSMMHQLGLLPAHG